MNRKHSDISPVLIEEQNGGRGAAADVPKVVRIWEITECLVPVAWMFARILSKFTPIVDVYSEVGLNGWICTGHFHVEMNYFVIYVQLSPLEQLGSLLLRQNVLLFLLLRLCQSLMYNFSSSMDEKRQTIDRSCVASCFFDLSAVAYLIQQWYAIRLYGANHYCTISTKRVTA